MRPALLATCFAFLLLAWPVEAQRGPAQPADGPPGAQGERIVMDAVFWAVPGDEAQTCLELPPSRIAITVRAEDVGAPQPVRYRFAPYWFRAVDSPPEIDAAVTREARTFDATLAGGRYCYTIVNGAEPPPDADVTGSTGQAQLVAVRIVTTVP
jgi:hypothetical protein